VGLFSTPHRYTTIGMASVLTSVGLSFEHNNPFHLDVLPQSITEASSVAGIFKQTPIIEQEATKQRVIEALEHSRYVHLSTHGRHCIEAPAFQCIYLAADEASDGRLFAYELLSLNLHNLELLTLSACETALGRFDLGDNLRGIPASLILAGVATIVGTLWEISPEPAEHFFKLLYRELQSGKNRLDAFAAAQRGVRSTYPRYIDWGAFYFIGDWRDWR
jgi:CHAT domain-containing protein